MSEPGLYIENLKSFVVSIFSLGLFIKAFAVSSFGSSIYSYLLILNFVVSGFCLSVEV